MKNLYDIVAEMVEDFCEKTYYGTCIARFEQSYDGKEWTKETEIVFFENCIDLVFDMDWCEGQTHIKDIHICHLDEVIIPNELVRCKDCAYWQDDWEISAHDPNWHYCSQNDTAFSADEYCSRGDRKDEVTE